jgi:hypothetical protein
MWFEDAFEGIAHSESTNRSLRCDHFGPGPPLRPRDARDSGVVQIPLIDEGEARVRHEPARVFRHPDCPPGCADCLLDGLTQMRRTLDESIDSAVRKFSEEDGPIVCDLYDQ